MQVSGIYFSLFWEPAEGRKNGAPPGTPFNHV
jgi:hypothetical protein